MKKTCKFTVNLGVRQFMRELSLKQQNWIKSHYPMTHYEPLAGDAGFRRYFRCYTLGQHFIFMDASEEPAIYRAFIDQTQHLQSANLLLPRLLAQENFSFWAILEDLGDDLLWRVLQRSENALSEADHYYRHAIEQLILLHPYPVQAYGRYSILDERAILEECQGWQEWCLQGLYQQTSSTLLIESFQTIADEVSKQPYVFMHRDFHSKNLLTTPDKCLGIIDYQDAMAGPMTYDLASLLRDCYIDWPEQNVITWALYYKKLAQKNNFLDVNVSDEEFLHWLDWTSIQRHLKALFTFSRKSLRDQNDDYLIFIPRTLDYLHAISSRYSELRTLTEIIKILREKNL